MIKRIIVTLLAAAILSISCAYAASGDEYVGKWELIRAPELNKLEIKRTGQNTFALYLTMPSWWDGKPETIESHAILKDGVLVLPKGYLAYVEADDTVVCGPDKFRRVNKKGAD